MRRYTGAGRAPAPAVEADFPSTSGARRSRAEERGSRSIGRDRSRLRRVDWHSITREELAGFSPRLSLVLALNGLLPRFAISRVRDVRAAPARRDTRRGEDGAGGARGSAVDRAAAGSPSAGTVSSTTAASSTRRVRSRSATMSTSATTSP